MASTIRIWDLPTRLFHWALALCVVGSVTTGQIGGAAMVWHFRCGYAVLSLLLFRILWGCVGGRWSRFASFVYSPATVLRYLKGLGAPEHSVGHNPAGAWSVFAMLAFLLLQVSSGVFSDDEIAASGPFSKFVSSAWVSQATIYHKNIGRPIVLGLLALHIGTVLYYLIRKRENLIRPMIHGDKVSALEVEGSRDDARSRAVAAVILLACVALVSWALKLAG